MLGTAEGTTSAFVLPSPVLVIAGERDEIVPPGFSRRLYDAAAEPVRFVLVPAPTTTTWLFPPGPS